RKAERGEKINVIALPKTNNQGKKLRNFSRRDLNFKNEALFSVILATVFIGYLWRPEKKASCLQIDYVALHAATG
ncbi:MAG: hypothetical protein KJO24_01040, partial [Gammaproteobacteria bacterium]|nr:hypothetical protein [Gammaproteobacteria bacterium]